MGVLRGCGIPVTVGRGMGSGVGVNVGPGCGGNDVGTYGGSVASMEGGGEVIARNRPAPPLYVTVAPSARATSARGMTIGSSRTYGAMGRMGSTMKRSPRMKRMVRRETSMSIRFASARPKGSKGAKTIPRSTTAGVELTINRPSRLTGTGAIKDTHL